MKPTLKPSHFFRTAYLIGWLKKETGQGYIALEKRIRQNQYEKYGLTAPATDTVRDYFRLRRSPAIDPQDGVTPPWLIAAELEVPGAAYTFFHPLFDLLLGQLESSIKWSERLQRIPTEWIEWAKVHGDNDQSAEWLNFNAALTKKRGRKRKQSAILDLEFIHMTLMRLPEPIFSILFKSAGFYRMFSRTYLPVEEEISKIHEIPGLDSLAAMFGLLLEASEIGDTNRFANLQKIVSLQLDHLDTLPECKYFCEEIKLLIKNTCPEEAARTYPAPQFYGYGLPSTWRSTNAVSHLKSEMKMAIQRDEKKRT